PVPKPTPTPTPTPRPKPFPTPTPTPIPRSSVPPTTECPPGVIEERGVNEPRGAFDPRCDTLRSTPSMGRQAPVELIQPVENTQLISPPTPMPIIEPSPMPPKRGIAVPGLW
ncbi:MAG: hypothetical protein ACO24D_17915, partial [bacterium]